MKRTCKDCGKEFELTDSEIRFYKNKKLELPKRCPACRAVRKDAAPSDAPKKNRSKQLLSILAVVVLFLLYFALYPPQLDNTPAAAVQEPTAAAATTEPAPQPDVPPEPDTPAEPVTDDGEVSYTDGLTPPSDSTSDSAENDPEEYYVNYVFRNQKLLNQHFEKHGREMGFANASDYEAAACAVANNPEALHKTEKEDGDDVYYIVATNEFVIVSTDGYIRTYFLPSGGLDYFNRQ